MYFIIIWKMKFILATLLFVGLATAFPQNEAQLKAQKLFKIFEDLKVLAESKEMAETLKVLAKSEKMTLAPEPKFWCLGCINDAWDVYDKCYVRTLSLSFTKIF